jgi:type IV pilus assembly protein PilW
MKSMRKTNEYMYADRRQRGLSLIELMVALVLGLIIVAALGQLFVNISRANLEMAKTNSQIENARFGMQFLRDDVMHAGFWGAHVPEFDDLSRLTTPTDYPTEILDPCLAYTTPWTPEHINYLIGVPIEVHSGAPGSCGAIIEDQVPNTDILIVRHANTCEPGVGHCDDTGTAGQLYFQASLCNSDTDPFALTLDPNDLLDRACSAPAPARKFVQSIYYIRSWSSDNPVEDGIPTLVRSSFDLNGGTLAQQAAVPLVEGIERFRVEVGVDSLSKPYTDTLGNVWPDGTAADPNSPIEWLDPDLWDTPTNRGDGIPDGAFVHCPTSGCNTYQLLNVVAVKLHILARANEASPGYTDTKVYTLGSSTALPAFNDGFKRHVFSTSVRLNNIAGRRETP